MNAAEFKTIRESLHLSAADCAYLLGIKSDRTIRYWESGDVDVPAGAAKELRAIDQAVEAAAGGDISPDDRRLGVSLVRYRSDEEMETAEPGALARFKSARVHGAMIARRRRFLRQAGVKVEVEYPGQVGAGLLADKRAAKVT